MTSPADPVITPDVFIVIMEVYTCVDMVLSLIGIITNAISTMAFLAMGADDGITVAFLFLSSSEFLCCLAALGQRLSLAFWVAELATDYTTWFSIDPYVFNVYFGNIRTGLFTIPVLITMYIAVAKCMCVVKPFVFKNVFFVTRTWWAMVGICAISIVTYLPVMATMGVVDQFDLKVNATRQLVWFSRYRDIVQNVVRIGRDSVPAVSSEIIVIFCVALMSRALSEAVRFRESFKHVSLQNTQESILTQVSARGSARLSGKELQVIKQVTLISAVYVVSNTPKIVLFLAIAFVPDLTQGRLYQNLYEVTVKTKAHAELYMSVVNIFIYYKYNSKFRQSCNLLASKMLDKFQVVL
ncbi:unnamed protein product [Lymnaea stagnalis]|uniref:G-protein coupled receptors family 1 profile domain-containing protein n=1 Tax=Lymnaea stagnalis TaxID=6523 RepID=A0AAV2IJM1_LYMST